MAIFYTRLYWSFPLEMTLLEVRNRDFFRRNSNHGSLRR